VRPNFSHLSVPALAWLIVPVAWLLARPYRGIRHDAILYAGQALSHLWPDIFSRDVFFAHGSQDSFSAFSALTAALFECVGVVAVEAWAPLAIHGIFLLLAFWLVRIDETCSGFEAWLALISLAAFPHLYDGQGVFAFAEPFLTARTLAEPLCLLAMCLMFRQRWAGAAIAVCTAALLHPLITAPILVVAWAYLSLGNRRWLWAALLVLIPVGLATSAVPPFDKLFLRYDPLWWSYVEEKNVHVLIGRWEVAGWQTLAFDLGILALAAVVAGREIGRLCKATILATVVLLAASAIGADLAHNVLLTSLQLWRVMWFAHLLALLFFPVVALRLLKETPHGLLVASSLFLAAVGIRWAAGWALLVWAGFAYWAHRKQVEISPRYVTLAVATNAVGVIVICTVIGLAGAEVIAATADATPLSILLAFATTPVVVISGALTLLWILKWPRQLRVISWSLVAFAAVASVMYWDRRDPWQRFVESSLHETHPFQKYIGEHQQVYWHNQLLGSWLVLKRPNYYSAHQGAGQLFNRGTMEVLAQRDPEFKGLQLQESLCGVVSGVSNVPVDESCSPTLDLVEEICSKQAMLDFMIFDLKLPRGVIDEWTFIPPSGHKSKTYYLYDCNKLRGV